MSYASLEDLTERAGSAEILQIADRDRDGAADPEVIDAALVHADNIVNGYVAAKYTLPFTSTPDLVRTWSGAPDYVEADYKHAIAALKDVARGIMMLPDATGAAPVQANGVHLSYSPEEVFSDRKLRGYND